MLLKLGMPEGKATLVLTIVVTKLFHRPKIGAIRSTTRMPLCYACNEHF
jgi:hypothetical protein